MDRDQAKRDWWASLSAALVLAVVPFGLVVGFVWWGLLQLVGGGD
jgi:hypothetical protein